MTPFDEFGLPVRLNNGLLRQSGFQGIKRASGAPASVRTAHPG
jgi:hypothetical protein